MHKHTIEVNSAEWDAMFTPDGKLDFNSRKGITKENDPLNRVDYKPDPRDGRVEFAEQKEFRKSLTEKHQIIDDDTEDEYNLNW